MLSRKMLFLFWLFSSLLQSICNAQAVTLTIAPSRNISYVIQGSNVTVMCLADNLQNKAIQWSHDNNLIALASKENIVFLDPEKRLKYSLTFDEEFQRNSTFTIHQFTVDDVGDVSCGATDAKPSHHQIDILHIPSKFYIEVNSNQTVFNQTSSLPFLYVDFDDWLNISCHAVNARPFALITWSWNDTKSFSKWNISSTQKTEMNSLYNSSSFLRIPPGFYRQLLLDNIYKEEAKEDLIAVSTTNAYQLDTDGFMNVTSEYHHQKTKSQLRTTAQSILEPGFKIAIKVTCTSTVDENSFVRSHLVYYGQPHIEGNLPSVATLTHINILFWLPIFIAVSARFAD